MTDRSRGCRCSLQQIQKYQNRISGPILDRIDLHVEVPALSYQTLSSEESAEPSSVIRQRIIECRQIQRERFKENRSKTNAQMHPRDIKSFARLDSEGRKLMESAIKQLRLSARAYYKILKISRTIADLAFSTDVRVEHIAEAIQYRSLDRQ